MIQVANLDGKDPLLIAIAVLAARDFRRRFPQTVICWMPSGKSPTKTAIRFYELTGDPLESEARKYLDLFGELAVPICRDFGMVLETHPGENRKGFVLELIRFKYDQRY